MPITVIVFIILIILISFGFASFAIKWDHDFKLKRERIRAEGGGNSLGTSELRGLIQEAMLETITPLEERLDLMEMHMRRLPEHDAEGAQLESALPDEPTED